MGMFQRRLHKLRGKNITFDKLTVVMLAGLSIGLMSEGYTPERGGVAFAEEGMSVAVNAGAIPVKVESAIDEQEEENLEPEIEEVKSETPKADMVGLTGLEDYQKEFIHKIAPVAVNVAKEYNVYPSIIVAQSILESDWGRSPLAVNANNLFGIKGTYNGEFVWHETKEDDGTGFQYTVTDKFAKYPSYKESIESNAKLIREGVSFDKNYYSGAWVENTSHYEEATLALTGTYATDTNYYNKVNRVIEEYKLHRLDTELHN